MKEDIMTIDDSILYDIDEDILEFLGDPEDGE